MECNYFHLTQFFVLDEARAYALYQKILFLEIINLLIT